MIRDNTSGFIPEIAESKFCPVKSFENYIEKLNPGNDRLWQNPKDSLVDTDQIWYNNKFQLVKKHYQFS